MFGANRADARRQRSDLLLDNAALFLDDDDFRLAAHEGGGALFLDRPGKADLVDIDAELAAGGAVQPKKAERFHQVAMRLAGGDKSDAGIVIAMDHTVDRICRGENGGSVQFGLHPVFQMQPRRIRPADVQPVGGVGQRRAREGGERRKIDRGSGLDQLGDGFHAHPQPGIAGQGEAEQPEGDQLVDGGRVQDRERGADEPVFGLVRDGRGDTAMVIAGHHQHAAVRRAAIHVAVLDGVARPVDAGSLAVPEPEDPVHGRRWLLFRLLRAGHDGGGHILVHGRQEIDLVAVEMPVGAPQLDIEGGERRAAIARYQPAGGQPRRRVEACLVQQHAHQRLCSGHEDAAR